MTALAEKQHLVSKVAARKSGVAITFTLGTGTYNATNDTWSSAGTSTVIGFATRVPGDPVRYQALGLVESEAPTLQFTPDTAGERPALNSSCSFGGATFVVRDVQPWSPAGSDVSSRVIVSRG